MIPGIKTCRKHSFEIKLMASVCAGKIFFHAKRLIGLNRSTCNLTY
jgi:hypothetical protein